MDYTPVSKKQFQKLKGDPSSSVPGQFYGLCQAFQKIFYQGNTAACFVVP